MSINSLYTGPGSFLVHQSLKGINGPSEYTWTASPLSPWIPAHASLNLGLGIWSPPCHAQVLVAYLGHATSLGCSKFGHDVGWVPGLEAATLIRSASTSTSTLWPHLAQRHQSALPDSRPSYCHLLYEGQYSWPPFSLREALATSRPHHDSAPVEFYFSHTSYLPKGPFLSQEREGWSSCLPSQISKSKI